MPNRSKLETKSHSLVTEEHVRKVLHQDKGKNAKLISWNVENFTKEGDNYSCVVSSVQVKYSSNGSELDAFYVVKLNPLRSVNTSQDLTNVLFIKESKFYLDLIPALNDILETIEEQPLCFPRCFHSSLEEHEEQIYFEDLRQRGFKMYDRRKGLDIAHTTLVLKELARFHSTSLLLQAKYHEPLEIRHDSIQNDFLSFTETSSKDIMIPIIEGCLEHSVQMLDKIGGYGRSTAWIESLKPHLEDIFTVEAKNNRYDVLCHGDCWNNNLLFRYNNEDEPIEIMLLDVQGYFKASPATDLNYLMYTSLTGDVRRPNLTGLLSSYYDSFQRVMEAGGLAMPFSKEELLKEFRAKNKLGGIFAMMILPATFIEPEDVPEMASTGIDYEELTKQLNAKAMTMLNSNPMVKPRFLETFDEFIETGLIS